MSKRNSSSASFPEVARARLWEIAGEERASFPSWTAGCVWQPGGRADIVFHIVLWLPNFLFEARTLHCGRCEGKQLDEGLGFFFYSLLRLLPPCQCFHCCDLYLLP